jgi:hypothetical protein
MTCNRRASAYPAAEGNLCTVLALFARWRRCSGCGLRILFVNAQATTAGDFLCGRCERRREALARECRPPVSLPARVALHLGALWSMVANDNRSTVKGEA